MRPDAAERARLRVTEDALIVCATEARRRGLAIVYGAFEVHEIAPAAGRVIGVCALGAYNATNAAPIHLAPDVERLSWEWDAIEHGFDLVPWRLARRLNQKDDALRSLLPFAWWDLGTRLHRLLRPMRADLLRGCP